MLVSKAEDIGKRVIYGDAGKKEILLAAGLNRAIAVVITHNDFGSCMRTLGQIRQLNPEVPVIVRTSDDSYMEQLRNAGATVVVPEVLESSLMLATQTLMLIGTSKEKVDETLRHVRDVSYSLLKG